ncbi:uncharacterized protein LOC106660500 [Trichogramma pretiosum]|uniref:uncharacterized protein LOC106660500 n=1 Tax=Trichogramma pretiosum TaxID=7493 RepID=UPI0006C9D7A8|nr:uncharacterized protein LOC106660500 [Trichogramma pretiosum]
MSCAVKGCAYKVKNGVEHDPNIQIKWLESVDMAYFKLQKWQGLCDSHFQPKYFNPKGASNAFKKVHVLQPLMQTRVVLPTKYLQDHNYYYEEEDLTLKYRNKRHLARYKRLKRNESEIAHINELAMLDVQEIVIDSADQPKEKSNIKELTFALQSNISSLKGIEQFKNSTLISNTMVQTFTGLNNYLLFNEVFQTVSPIINTLKYKSKKILTISNENKLFLTFWKIRRNIPDADLAIHFNCTQMDIKKIISSVIDLLVKTWAPNQQLWPSLDTLNDCLPQCFKENYSLHKKKLIGPKVTRLFPKTPNQNILSLSQRPVIIKKMSKFKSLKTKLDSNYENLAPEIAGICFVLSYFTARELD